MPTTILRSRDGQLDDADRIALAGLGERLAQKPTKILLHLHGGLVSQAAGEESAKRLSGATPDGLGLADDWEQIYVVWRTGVLETLKTNWEDLLHNDRLYKAILKKLIEFVAGKLGLPGVAGRSAFNAVNLTPQKIEARLRQTGGNPFADLDVQIEIDRPGGRGPVMPHASDVSLALEFQQFLLQDHEFNKAAAEIDAYVNREAAGRAAAAVGDVDAGKEAYERLSKQVQDELDDARPSPQSGRSAVISVAGFLIKHGAAIAWRTIGRFRSRRDHGFYATLVEELARELYGDLIGATIWGMMTKDAADHFGASQDLGSELLAMLERYKPAHIVVSAHSAGSIWATALLHAIKRSGADIRFDLVLLAPAVRMDLFADALDAAGDRIGRCRMFTMNDPLERADAVLGHDRGYVYPSSLLYLVSGLFEEREGKAFADAPLLGLQRFLEADLTWLADTRQISAAQRISNFFHMAGHDIVYAQVSGAAGLSSQANSHGGFDDEHHTVASIASFMQASAP